MRQTRIVMVHFIIAKLLDRLNTRANELLIERTPTWPYLDQLFVFRLVGVLHQVT